MAKHVLRNAGVSVGGIDLSDHVRSLELASEAEAIDVSRHAATRNETRRGILADSLEVLFWADFAAGEVDATLAPLYAASTSTPVVVRAGSGGVVVRYLATCRLIRYERFGSELGAGARATAVFIPETVFAPIVERYTVGSTVRSESITQAWTQGSLVQSRTV
ncbi:MAG TPA: hypothetical protein VFT76_00245 [Actinomycetota bacterium]|nr:hypothetical protein [Actinomycetota bacterium]